tara:strand:+ start:2506 stop:2796 length:291 start_codon:yes stop_codon:yes gene_type:complete
MNKEAQNTLFQIRKQYRDDHISKDTLKSNYSEFEETYPQIFEMICSPVCDDTLLNKMVQAQNLVQAGNISQHDASVQIGQVLVDKYVKPRLAEKDE